MDLLNDIMAALSKALNGVFPDVPVFAEEIPQELPERCFLIGFAGQVETALGRCDRYAVTGSLDITYLAPEELPDVKEELNRVAFRLSFGTEIIEHNGLSLRLRRHNCRTDGNELHDICPFYAAVRRVTQPAMMEDLKIKKN